MTTISVAAAKFRLAAYLDIFLSLLPGQQVESALSEDPERQRRRFISRVDRFHNFTRQYCCCGKCDCALSPSEEVVVVVVSRRHEFRHLRCIDGENFLAPPQLDDWLRHLFARGSRKKRRCGQQQAVAVY